MSWLAAKKYSNYSKSFRYSIDNYEIGIEIDPRRRSYQANVSITLTAEKNSRQFPFLLSDQCSINTVNYLGLALPYKAKSVYKGLNEITATLPRSADSGEKLVIVFIYSGEIPGRRGETLALPPGKHWYPYSPSPQTYSATLKVTTDESIRVVGSGQYISEQPANTKIMTQWATTEPFRGIHLLAGDFLKTARDTQPTLDVYYPRRYMNQGKKVADQGEKVVAMLTEKLGPPPVDSCTFVIAENPRENIDSSLYLTGISTGFFERLKEHKSSKDRSIRLFYSIARELSHRWLKYNLAVNHPQDQWYLDGLAEYLSWIALEEEFGLAIREKMMNEARTAVLSGPKASIQREACGISREFPPWLTAKAGWIMRIIHCLTGDRFFPALQDIIEHSRGNAPTAQEFFLSLEKISGTDLSQVYGEWIQSGRQLIAEICDARSFQDEEEQWQLVFSLVNKGSLDWPHPIEIAMDYEDGSTHTRCLKIQNEPHLVISKVKITQLCLDPNLRLLNWAQKTTYKL